MFNYLVCLFGFVVFGANDASIGALLSHLEDKYEVSDAWIALCFLSPITGYFIATLLTWYSHKKLGYHGVAIVAALIQFTTYFMSSLALPFPVYVFGLAIAGYGCGTIEASWNTYLSDFHISDPFLGGLHRLYGMGTIVSPAVATWLFKTGYTWRTFSQFMIRAAILELFVAFIAFFLMMYVLDLAEEEENMRLSFVIKDQTGNGNGGGEGGLTEALKSRSVWMLATTLVFYMDAEVQVGANIIMISQRAGFLESMDLVAMGYWVGITLCRFILGVVTNPFGQPDKLSMVYMVLSIICIVTFWDVPRIPVSSTTTIRVASFIGPILPFAISEFADILPRRIQIAGVGLAAVIGGGVADLILIPFIPFIENIMPTTVTVPVLSVFMTLMWIGMWIGMRMWKLLRKVFC